MNTTQQPVADRPEANSKASLHNYSAVYTYMTLPPYMRRIIPAWLWGAKVNNVPSKARVMSTEKSEPLFKEEDVDLHTMIEDFFKQGYKPFHIHLMVRENGNIRIRVSWMKGPIVVMQQRELEWIRMMFRRFLWNTMAHPNIAGTEHLPPHIAINCSDPKERDQAMSVLSVQVLQGALELINDPS